MRLHLPSNSRSTCKIRVHELFDLKNKLRQTFKEEGALSCPEAGCELKQASFNFDKQGTWFVGKEFDYLPEVYLTFKEIGYKTFIVNGGILARKELPADLKIDKLFVAYQSGTLGHSNGQGPDLEALTNAGNELGLPIKSYFQDSETRTIQALPTGLSCDKCKYKSDYGEEPRDDISERVDGLSINEALDGDYQSVSKLLSKPNPLISESGIHLSSFLNSLSPGEQTLVRLLSVIELEISGITIEVDYELFAGEDQLILKQILEVINLGNITKEFPALPLTNALPISSFKLRTGKLIGITGPIGSGKSKFLDSIKSKNRCGQGYPTKATELQETIFYQSGLYEHLKEDITAISLTEKTPKKELFKAGFLDNWLALKPSELAQQLRKSSSYCSLLNDLSVNKTLGTKLSSLSRSEIRKVQIVKHLSQPSYPVCLDHTLSKLAGDDISIVLSELKKITNQGGAVVMVTHHPELLRAADSVYTL